MELRLEKVTKRYKYTEAVGQFSCVLNNGVYGLLGENGAGKTTLMKMICTLTSPDQGKILYEGKDIWKMDREYRKILGYLPQEFGFYPDFTAEEYLMYVASIKGMGKPAAKGRVQEMLSVVGMEAQRKKKMKKLSGGMKRRIGIAQAMLNDPRILVLDEPTAGLDPNERIRFRNLISGLAQDRLVLLSTHIVSDIEYAANQILLMKEGRLAAEGTVPELVKKMQNQVWKVEASQKEAEAYCKAYKVSAVKNTAAGVRLRILAEQQPCPQAQRVEASLEDIFLEYFGKKAGERDDTL